MISAKKKNIILGLSSLLCFSFLLCFGANSYAIMIDATKIKEISIYGHSSGFGESLYPGSIVFNVTNTDHCTPEMVSICEAQEMICDPETGESTDIPRLTE